MRISQSWHYPPFGPRQFLVVEGQPVHVVTLVASLASSSLMSVAPSSFDKQTCLVIIHCHMSPGVGEICFC